MATSEAGFLNARHCACCPGIGLRERRLGSVNAWVVILLPVLISMMGLGIDVGYTVWVGQQLQVAADAGALAGVQLLRESAGDARQHAADISALNRAIKQPVLLELNEGNDPAGDIVVGRFDRDTGIFTATTSHPTAIKVVARRTSGSLNGSAPLLFGPLLGLQSANISRQAIAMLGGGTGAGLICLDEDERKALWIHGSVNLLLDGGAIQVNSSNVLAAQLHSGITTDAVAVNCVGGINTVGNPTFDAELNEGVDPLPDPLSYLQPPTYDPAVSLGGLSQQNGASTLVGGYYSGGISATGGTVTLTPGIYVLGGAGLNISGNASLYAEGCMFYVVGGKVDLTGTGSIVITPPDPDLYSYPGVDVYEGVSIFQSRTNTSAGRILGTSLMNLEGTLYFPTNHMELGGEAVQFGNQLIVGTAEIHGNSTLIINYDGRNAAPGNHPFLVL